jgi:hypothetical protein
MEVSKKRDRPEIDLPIIDCPEYMIVPEALSSRSRSQLGEAFALSFLRARPAPTTNASAYRLRSWMALLQSYPIRETVELIRFAAGQSPIRYA